MYEWGLLKKKTCKKRRKIKSHGEKYVENWYDGKYKKSLRKKKCVVNSTDYFSRTTVDFHWSLIDFI